MNHISKRISQKLEQRIEDDPRLGLQVQLEILHNKNQLLSRIRHEFLSAKEQGGPDVVAYLEARNIDVDLGLDVMVQLVLHKRTTISTMVGILRRHVNPKKQHLQDLQAIADQLKLCVEHDVCDWDPTSAGGAGHLIIRHDISEETKMELEKFQFPLPMVTRPRKLRRNTDSAFVLTSDGNGGSVILRDNHHDGDVCLDHLNRMNAVRFSIDGDTAFMIKNRWRSLDKPKPGETRADFEKRVRAFEKYDRTAMEVISMIVSDYEGVSGSNEFYLTHKYDKRGRTYCQGYHVTYQGAPWNKAVVQLAEKEIVPL
ncbi:MAG: hypothetical protein Unbinned4120contig1000_39 [Prokaryotic dsDNA virus sp.]|nr:MAG: hypothetical protein Unbinned4120contig1000_39 [Prokaryotic dsDNA virus sp.]